MKRSEWEARLNAGPALLLDGAMGTELERRGADASLPLWSARALRDDPALVKRIHRDYVDAGADILTANTFRTQRRTCGADAQELTSRAVQMARAAAATQPDVWIAGSAPPLEDCYRPDLVPADHALRAEHAEHLSNLCDAGVDLIIIETMNCIREARTATEIAAKFDTPCWVSFVCADAARLLSGETLAAAIAEVCDFDVLGISVNCLRPSTVAACLPSLQQAPKPFGAYANLGEPKPGGGFTDACDPEIFADHASRWLDAGARLVGGCCGTTPEHTQAMRKRIQKPPQ